MNALKRTEDISRKRLLNIDEACAYIGIGKNNGRNWLRSINANVQFGRRVVYDKTIIDKKLDCLSSKDVV